MRELREGRPFTLPDGRVGRVGRCRSCGAEVIFAPNLHRSDHRWSAFDVDGAPHVNSCSDAQDDREAATARSGR